MSLATRCTTCSTAFRVVQDQLKVSEGWVRCGRCDTVFNALEGLFDLDREGGAALLSESAPASAVAGNAASDEAQQRERSVDDRLFRKRRDDDADWTPARQVSKADRLEFADAQFDPDSTGDDAYASADAAERALEAPEPLTSDAAPGTPEAQHDEVAEHDESIFGPPMPDDASPAFIRHADARARWQRPRVRAALGAAALLLGLGLALQAGHHFRDRIAAYWPESRPLLLAWCAQAGCSIEPLRRIDAITVESTALTRLPNSEAYRLSVNLRNRSSTPLALPWVDLNVTDNNGALVSRRALQPKDFQVATNAIAPGAEQALQLLLSAPGARTTGYTVEIFYP